MSNEPTRQSGPSAVESSSTPGVESASLGALAVGVAAIALLGRGSRTSSEVPDRSKRAPAAALLAFALGAASVGALAIGAVAIGRLAIGKASFRELEVDQLTVRKLRVFERDGPTP
jgi:hypothetical protein